MSKSYNKSIDDVLKDLNVQKEIGLTDKEIEDRKLKYGRNEFTEKEEGSLLEDIIDNLKEPMILILIAAAVISGLIGELHDAIGIIGAITIGIAIGMITEGKSKKAAEALSKMTADIEVKVLRNKTISIVHKTDLVPGDIVYLETGDMIPADGRLIETIDLKVREDMLTGESDDVSKKANEIISMEKIEAKGEVIEQEPIPAKQINMVFGGTLVAYGRGTFVVTSIGDNTEMGKIAQNLIEDGETPLQIKLGDLGGKIAKVSSAIAGLLFIFKIIQMVTNNTLNIDFSGFESFMTSIDPIKTAFTVCVALIVAAVPEGLPTMINMTLAITMQKMAKINALVTKKEACETIGSISVICSDKTGTLTQNRMTVEVTNINGPYFEENCIINSTADIDIVDDQVNYMGNATECALLLKHKEIDYRARRKESNIVEQEQFSSATKKMTTTIKLENKNVKLIKGAPEVVLEQCKFIHFEGSIVENNNENREKVLNGIKELQDKAMRVLGFAYQESDKDDAPVFNGFVGIKDPLRDDVKEAVTIAKTAGVQTKMLTGDNINTAIAIGEELGLLTDGMRAVESSYIDTLTDEELEKEIQTIAIVARSKPDTKMRVVSALQNNGEIVAVTGDGINDAPALSKADVGVAMGISGTEVSKNAADIILTDDSFSTIVEGIKWGRGIYDNFQRFIQFQLTVNVVAFFIAIATTLLGQEMPFTTVQLLWVNIIMDGPPALALGLEPVRKHVLNRKPTSRNASMVSKSMIKSIIFNATYISTILLLQSTFNILNVTPDQNGTVMFGLFAFFALFNAFNCREFETDSIFQNLLANRLALKIIGGTAIAQVIFTQVLKGLFNSVALDVLTWSKVIGLASTVILINEIIKLVLRKIKK